MKSELQETLSFLKLKYNKVSLQETLNSLNLKYNKKCQLRFGPCDSYLENTIIVNPQGIDPVFSLYHEFAHALQDYPLSLQSKLNKHQLRWTLFYTVLLTISWLAPMSLDSGMGIIGAVFSIIMVLLLVNFRPLWNFKRTKKGNHLIELKCDRFAARHLQRKPFNLEQYFSYSIESYLHPASAERIAHIESMIRFK